MKNDKTPAIRFKGFTEAWEQRQLWELTFWDKKFNEVDSSKQQKTIKYPYVLADSLNNLEEPNGDVLLLSTGSYIGYTTKEKAGSNLCYGEIVAIPWGGVANIKYCNGFFVTADNRIATSSNKNKLDNKFLCWWMESNLISIQSTYRGASIKHPSMNDVLSLKISFPSIKEQRIISNYLDQVDTLITLHQRKCDVLMNIKKSLLEKMFPTNGDDKPKIRFKGFTEAWEQREVNEIADRYDNLRVPVASSQRVEGTTPYYGANGIQDYVDGYTHEGEFVLVAEDGANDLKNYPVQYVNGRIWVNNHAHVLQSNQNNDTKFLKYLIRSTKIENLLVGGGRAKLNAEVLMKIDLTLPKKQEQIKISSLFDSLDFLITLHQRKCETLRNMKKSLLERMFI